MWQNVARRAHLKIDILQNVGDAWPFCENLIFVPTPVWKPAIPGRVGLIRGAQGLAEARQLPMERLDGPLTHVCIYVYVSLSLYIYIYRERDIDKYIYIYIYNICIYIYICYIYIYIYVSVYV